MGGFDFEWKGKYYSIMTEGGELICTYYIKRDVLFHV